jgi:hypothetical protein
MFHDATKVGATMAFPTALAIAKLPMQLFFKWK